MSTRRGIALPMILAVVVALGLLSSLALGEAVREARVATLTEDAVRARAAALSALAHVHLPVDLPTLCLSGPLMAQHRTVAVPAGSAIIRWRSLQPGVVRAEVEGLGIHGARHRLQAVMVADSGEVVMGLYRCPSATRLLPAAGRWVDGLPDG